MDGDNTCVWRVAENTLPPYGCKKAPNCFTIYRGIVDVIIQGKARLAIRLSSLLASVERLLCSCINFPRQGRICFALFTGLRFTSKKLQPETSQQAQTRGKEFARIKENVHLLSLASKGYPSRHLWGNWLISWHRGDLIMTIIIPYNLLWMDNK